MTLDLDELERKAKAAQECRPGPWTPLVDSSGGGAWIHEIGNSDYDGQLPTPVIEHACAANPTVVLALIELVRDAICLGNARFRELHEAHLREKDLEERVRALERVAKAVRGITKDAAENGDCSDCPYVSQEEARELLAIIDGAQK